MGSYDLPWLMEGDFNCILKDDENEGGSVRMTSDMMRFQDTLNIFALGDLGWNCGSMFTWSNRRYKKGLIKKRLDRFVASEN